MAEALRTLSVARRSAVKAKTQAVNQLRALLVSAPSSLRDLVLKVKTEHCVAACAALQADDEKNAVMAKVHESALNITAGEEHLSLYRWNTGVARHYFCSRCGIYTFHRKRSAPDHYGVNVFCLDNFDVASMPVRATEGASMTLAPDGARSEWPGPRASEA